MYFGLRLARDDARHPRSPVPMLRGSSAPSTIPRMPLRRHRGQRSFMLPASLTSRIPASCNYSGEPASRRGQNLVVQLSGGWAGRALTALARGSRGMAEEPGDRSGRQDNEAPQGHPVCWQQRAPAALRLAGIPGQHPSPGSG